MAYNYYSKDEIINNLDNYDISLDEEERKEGYELTLYIVGGAALMIMDLIDRTTTDADVLLSTKDGEFLTFTELFGEEYAETVSLKYDINTDVMEFGDIGKLLNEINKSEYTELLVNKFMNFKLKVPSLEFIALMKLMAYADDQYTTRDRNRNGRDLKDITSKKFMDRIEIDKLNEMIDNWKNNFVKNRPRKIEVFELAFNEWKKIYDAN